MCPDRDLVSAYVDGEVPSPWRERLEEHIASCPSCAELASGFSSLSERMRAHAEPGEAAALARGRERLEALFADASDRSLRGLPRSAFSRDGWKRSVSLPLPFAAAAAVLVVVLGGATAVLAFRHDRGVPMPAIAASEIGSQLAKPASMDEVLRFLGSNEGQVQLTINLPAGTTFGSVGKPVIMRSDQSAPGEVMGERAP